MIAVLGGAGLLGRNVAVELAARGHEVRVLARAQCDVTIAASVRDATAGAAAILNCAAFTDVDAAELHERDAFAVNASGAEHAARAAAAHGALLVQISTDFVFDGKSERPYHEHDEPAPLSAYGRSKLAGEQLAAAACSRLAIVRTQGLYGRGGRNFASTLPARLAAGAPLRIDRERRVQPTPVVALARQLVAIVEAGAQGTFHACCSGATTWADFAGELARLLGLPRTWEAVPTAAFGHRAARPACALLERRALRELGLDRMPSWDAGLAEELRA